MSWSQKSEQQPSCLNNSVVRLPPKFVALSDEINPAFLLTKTGSKEHHKRIWHTMNVVGKQLANDWCISCDR